MSFDFLKASAKRQEEKQREKARELEERIKRRNTYYRYSAVWHGWARPWGEVIRMRERGDDPVKFLAGIFDEMAETVQLMGYRENLALANEKFDPSDFDDTEHENAAYAVRTIIEIVDDIISKRRTSKNRANALLKVSPLPPLDAAGYAEDLLVNAEHWPLKCEECGHVQPPNRFRWDLCEECENSQVCKSPPMPDEETAPTHPTKEITRENPREIHTIKKRTIPSDKRTKPMTKREALNYIGWPAHARSERAAREWLNASIRDGEYCCEKLSNKQFVFHVDDFPEKCRDEIRKI